MGELGGRRGRGFRGAGGGRTGSFDINNFSRDDQGNSGSGRGFVQGPRSGDGGQGSSNTEPAATGFTGGTKSGGGFKKGYGDRNWRGQKWGDGKGKNFGRRDGHRGGGGGRWNDSGMRRGDSQNPDGISKPSVEIVDYWSDAQAQPLPEVPFQYEPYETDFPAQAAEFIKQLKDSKDLLRDERGVPYDDCRGLHTYTEVCQFCDGRKRGPWVHENVNQNDPAFRRYQDSILRSPYQGSRWNPDVAQEMREVIKLGVDADDEADASTAQDLGEDFGMFDQKLRIAD